MHSVIRLTMVIASCKSWGEHSAHNLAKLCKSADAMFTLRSRGLFAEMFKLLDHNIPDEALIPVYSIPFFIPLMLIYKLNHNMVQALSLNAAVTIFFVVKDSRNAGTVKLILSVHTEKIYEGCVVGVFRFHNRGMRGKAALFHLESMFQRWWSVSSKVATCPRKTNQQRCPCSSLFFNEYHRHTNGR